MRNGDSSGRTSPPTQRVVAILDFLAKHPHDRFGLSELARRLGLSKPTCLGIVTTLAESGYLVRDGADKTYRLGPSLITLGHIAQESLRVNPAARAELSLLSSTFNTTRPWPASSTTGSRCWNWWDHRAPMSGCGSARVIPSRRRWG